jgi:hypothetical protein
MFDLQWLVEQGIVLEVEHRQAQVEAGPPVGVDLFQLSRAATTAMLLESVWRRPPGPKTKN